MNGSHAQSGEGDVMVIEADEAYGSIEMFYPTVAVVTSVDADTWIITVALMRLGKLFSNSLIKCRSTVQPSSV